MSEDGVTFKVAQLSDTIISPFATRGGLDYSSSWRIVPLFDPEQDVIIPKVKSKNELCIDCSWLTRFPSIITSYYKEIGDTRSSYKIQFPNRRELLVSLKFGSRAIYTLVVKNDDTMVFLQDKKTGDYYLPLVWSVVFLLVLWVTKKITIPLKKKQKDKQKFTKNSKRTKHDWMSRIKSFKQEYDQDDQFEFDT